MQDTAIFLSIAYEEIETQLINLLFRVMKVSEKQI